jgi:cystathionine beta-synthase
VPPDHPDNYVQTAKRIVAETPGAVLADQFYNPVNPEAHYRTTGPELWAQTDGRITHFVAAAGTGGTISGAGRYLKEQRPGIRVVAGDPPGSIFAGYHATGEKGEGAPYKVEGIGNDKLPSTLDFSLIDDYRTVGDREAFHMARRLTREEGLFVGGSAGLIVHLAVQVAHEANDPDALVVCVLPDTGERYLSKLYSEEWMRENRLLEPERLTAVEMLARKDDGSAHLICVERTTKVREALSVMTEHDISQLPVCEAGECVGSVPESLLMSRIIEDPAALEDAVEAIMEPPFPVIDADLPMSRIGRLLTRQCPAVLVRTNGELGGIITRYDMVRYLTT